MKIVLAPDSFKGTFSSMEVIALLAEGCRIHFPDAELVRIPMADGGEGTVEAFVSALGFEKRTDEVPGPLGFPVMASLGIKGHVAVIEMAQASGISLVGEAERNPLETSSEGTGELIRRALDEGARRILVGIGGSATNDGGMGMASSLGIRFADSAGQSLAGCGKNLERIRQIDVSGLDSRIADCEIVAICDVKNPLTGPLGATRIFGPQKGADPAMVERLEAGMENYRDCLTRLAGVNPNTLEGSGAAGGVGAAIALLLGGKLQSGIQTVLNAADFDALTEDADFVITGEGRLDEQSLFGKVPFGIARRCWNRKPQVFVLAGSIAGNLEALYDAGVAGVYPVVTEPCSLENALTNPRDRIVPAIDHMLRFIKAAQRIR